MFEIKSIILIYFLCTHAYCQGLSIQQIAERICEVK